MRIYCHQCQNIINVDNPTGLSEISCSICGKRLDIPRDAVGPGVVIGDFLIEKLIGGGGMGAVYLANQLSLDREVALKVILPQMANDTEYAEGLIREARAAAKLSHPNIVQAYAVGKDGNVFYFAMELIRGKTFKQILGEQKVIPCNQAVKVIIEIAGALAAAWNEQKLVHQDIKPDNIMLDSNGFAKLADLGLARKATAPSPAGGAQEVMGTPQYISPEQLTGIPTDIRSDIYSLGATFYHFLTGRFPYMAETAEQMAEMHINGCLEPPKLHNPTIPDEINAIIMKMMARDIELRYQRPEDLIRDLQEYARRQDVPLTRNISFIVNATKGLLSRVGCSSCDPTKLRPVLRKLIKITILLLVCAAVTVGALFIIRKQQIDAPLKSLLAIFGIKNKDVENINISPANVTGSQQKQSLPVGNANSKTTRDEFTQAAGELRDYIRLNPNSSQEILGRYDAFMQQFSKTISDEEKSTISRLISIIGPIDDENRIRPERHEILANQQTRLQEIRIQAEKTIQRNNDTMPREVTSQQIGKSIAPMEQDNTALVNNYLRENRKFMVQMLHDFRRAAAAGDKDMLEKIVNAHAPSIEIENPAIAAEQNKVTSLRSLLSKDFMRFHDILNSFHDLEKYNINMALPSKGIMKLISISENGVGRFRNLSNEEILFDFESNPVMREKMLRQIGGELKLNSHGGNTAPFFYGYYIDKLDDNSLKSINGTPWFNFVQELQE